MDDILSKAQQFQNYAVRKSMAHYAAAEVFAMRHLRLGIPVTVATTIVATAIFTTLSESGGGTIWISVATGGLSVGAAILSGLQTFLKYSDVASDHRRAAVGYEVLRRAFDLLILELQGSDDRQNALKRLREVTEKLDAVAESAPAVPDRIYNASVARLGPPRAYTSHADQALDPLTAKSN